MKSGKVETQNARSLWGWGYSSRYEDPEGLRQLGQLIAAGGKVAPRAPSSPVPLAEARIAPCRSDVPSTLAHVLRADDESRAGHAYGRAYGDIVRGFRGDFRGAPDLVAYPTNEDDVRRILDFCQDSGYAVVPYGGGTTVVRGVEGDREKSNAVVSLDLHHLNRVVYLSVEDRRACVQAGILGPALERELRANDLTFRHYPQSFEFSTVGGWIATRAGGHFATLYTHIDGLVASVRMLTPSGELCTTAVPATGAGPEPKHWALGSEGALGVILEATLRVRPRALYRARATLRFARFEDGVRACRDLAWSNLYPANCRLVDAQEAALNGVDISGHAILLLAFESTDHPVEAALNRGLDIARGAGGELKGPPQHSVPGDQSPSSDAASDWKAAFIDAPYLQSKLVALGVLADTFETCTTWSSFAALDAALRERLSPMLRVDGQEGLLTRRFTHVYPDGPAPYYTFLTTVAEGSELSRWAEIKEASLEIIAEHGATVTHHHAVGRTHRAAYHREIGPTGVALLRGIKSSVDPEGVMNPGALV